MNMPLLNKTESQNGATHEVITGPDLRLTFCAQYCVPSGFCVVQYYEKFRFLTIHKPASASILAKPIAFAAIRILKASGVFNVWLGTSPFFCPAKSDPVLRRGRSTRVLLVLCFSLACSFA